MVWLILLFPLFGFIANGLLLRNSPKKTAYLAACGVMLVSFIFATIQFVSYMLGDHNNEPILYYGFSWISAGSLSIPVELIYDRLSGFMSLIVTGIGTLIHIYAGGYLHDEAKFYRFFAYLNLFVFMMLILVFGNSLGIMFIGWEGVGLCSYLLIGFWFESFDNASAGMKAFLVNRIGDVGFLLGIFLCFKMFQTLSFTELRLIIESGSYDQALLPSFNILTAFLFLAVCGKSAQIPLYVWLPDAMAGPTPVSALIHAATMVTAGVYLMVRMNFIFFLAPETMIFIAWTGGLTALMAASIALVQNDIKKVLAYSTVSQLGFMVLACGVGAFSSGFFHVFTHACFKALLFMAAGSIIVALHHKQDMLEMGGLKRLLPITHLVSLIGVLAIIGTPGLSGFFSKDEILWNAYIGSGPLLWGVAVLAACFTAFYMVRLYALTFLGDFRGDEHTKKHIHETPVNMWAPLIVLAFLSIFVGYLGVPELMGGSNIFHHFLEPILVVPKAALETWAYQTEHHSHSLEWGLMLTSVGLAMSSALFALFMYRNGISSIAVKMKSAFGPLHSILSNKYKIDELYNIVFVTPLKNLGEFSFTVVDVNIVDGIVNAVAQGFSFLAGFVSFKMTGSIHRHGLVMVLGVLCFFVGLILL